MSRFQPHLAALLAAAVVALIAVNIKSVPNSPPIGVDDSFEVAEGSLLVVDPPGLLDNDFDPDGDAIASGFHSDPADGNLLAMAQDGGFTYEPDPGFVGVDSFTYAVRDDLGSVTDRSVDATITVTAASGASTEAASPAAWASSSAARQAALASTGSASKALILVVLLAVGFLVIAFGVRRARAVPER
jgi:hypothetical protein